MHVVIVVVVVLSKHVVELFTLTFVFLGSNEPGSLKRSFRARDRSPIPKGKWKPIDARKFGYDVSVVESK